MVMGSILELHCSIGSKVIRCHFKQLVDYIQPTKLIKHCTECTLLDNAELESYSNDLIERTVRNREMLLQLSNYPRGTKCLIFALTEEKPDSPLFETCRGMWRQYKDLQDEAKVTADCDWTQKFDQQIERALSSSDRHVLSHSSSFSSASDVSNLEDLDISEGSFLSLQESGEDADVESFDEDTDCENSIQRVITKLNLEQITSCMPLTNQYFDRKSRQRVQNIFNEGSHMINNGHHFEFTLYRKDMQSEFPSDPDVRFVLLYLQASSLLWQNDFEASEVCVRQAIRYSRKTSRPSRTLVEILSSRCWMYFQENRLHRLYQTCQDAIQMIEADPQGCTGLPAGWIYIDFARFWLALPTVSNVHCFLHIRGKAIESYEEALVHFQQDDTDDKVFGLLFSTIMLANVVLACGDHLQTIHFIPPQEDIQRARDLLLVVQDGEYPVPRILKVQLKVSLCDFQIRMGRTHRLKALQYAEEALDEAIKMKMPDQVMYAELRIKFLNLGHHQANSKSKYFSHLPISSLGSEKEEFQLWNLENKFKTEDERHAHKSKFCDYSHMQILSICLVFFLAFCFILFFGGVNYMIQMFLV